MGFPALVWLGTALGAYERYTLRPELYGYVCLLAHVWLLCGRITLARIVAALVVQVLAANVHSYWLLDLAIAAAFTGEAAVRAIWQKWVLVQHRLEPELRRRLARLAVCTALMVVVPAISPGTWRTVVFPFQTLSALRKYHITGGSPPELQTRWQAENLHPWALIGEFYKPFTPNLFYTWTTVGFIALLAMAAPAEGVLLWRRRWALATIIPGFILVGLTMRRNIAPAAIVVWPVIALAGHDLAGWLARRSRGPRTVDRRSAAAGLPRSIPMYIGSLRFTPLALLALACLLSLTGIVAVASNLFYYSERREWRFGAGTSWLALPLEACRWIDEHRGHDGPAFTDFGISSNIVYFSRSVTAVPVLTNTWATPISRMRDVVQHSGGLRRTCTRSPTTGAWTWPSSRCGRPRSTWPSSLAARPTGRWFTSTPGASSMPAARRPTSR